MHHSDRNWWLASLCFVLCMVVLWKHDAIASGIQALATVPAGGTGLPTLTAHAVLVGAGTSPVSLAGPGVAGQCFLSNGAGADPTYQACPGSGGGGITVYSASALTVTANTYYIPIGGGGNLSTTETNVDVEAPGAATITNFYVQSSVALGMGNTGVFTWRKAGVSQSVTCTITGAAQTSCNDLTHSFTVAQGDLIDIQLVTTGTIVVTPNIVMAVQFGTTGSNGTASTRGAYASQPTCNAGANGNLYIATDSGFEGQCNGTSWYWSMGDLHGLVATTTSVSSIWYNQTSATVANLGGTSVRLTGVSGGSNNIQGRLQVVPSTPYTYAVCFITFLNNSNFAGAGLFWTDGTAASNKAVDWVLQGGGLTFTHQKWNNATSFASGYTVAPALTISSGNPLCFGLQDDGTNRKIGLSVDGQSWISMGTEVHADFLTPTHLGYEVNTGASNTLPAIIVLSEQVVVGTLF